ncbi:f-box domain-containing protein [Gigaspora margarita]|uniref:F-box domain-containing protein n=1 Tax=Gigaspora margarita TaxID=4874 RepID=A0A8H4AJ52_GIGMA|nr:f-box domain-containing protein [Gigaspora margarita]
MALPNECFIEIFNNLRTDFKSLFSCLLVNRQWCRIIIPILWNEPTKYSKDRRLIKIYLSALNAEEQALLVPFNINFPNCPRPLFEYASYTKSVGFFLPAGVKNWLDVEGSRDSQLNKRIPVEAIKYALIKMFLRTSKNLKCLTLSGVINKAILESLYMKNTIIDLSLLHIYFDCNEIELLMKIISKSTKLDYLSLSYNQLGFKGMEAYRSIN